MNQEQWIKWKPIAGLHTTYKITKVVNDAQGFTIVMKTFDNDPHTLKVLFEEYVNAYRYTKKCYRLLINKPSIASLHAPWAFFKISNSSYLQWLSQESLGFFPATYFTHFVFVGTNTVVDVTTNYEPQVTIIK